MSDAVRMTYSYAFSRKKSPELWVWDVWRKYFGFYWPVIMVTHMNKIIHNPWDICIIRRIYCIHSSSDILYTQFIGYAIFMKIRHPCGLCAVYIVRHTCWGGNLNAVTQHLSVINPEASDFYSFLSCVCDERMHYSDFIWASSLITTSMGPIWGPSGADRTQVGLMLAPWTLLSGIESQITNNSTVLFNSLFSLTSNKTPKLHITGPLWGGSTWDLWIPLTNCHSLMYSHPKWSVTNEFPSQRASIVESISMSWYCHVVEQAI